MIRFRRDSGLVNRSHEFERAAYGGYRPIPNIMRHSQLANVLVASMRNQNHRDGLCLDPAQAEAMASIRAIMSAWLPYLKTQGTVLPHIPV